MTLITRIKEDQVAARKAKDSATATLLTTLIGEAEMVGKNAGNRESTDDEVVAVIKKFVKNTRETLSVLDTRDIRVAGYGHELAILEGYLPQQLGKEMLAHELLHIKTELNAGPKDMGKVLGLLKQRFPGQYDGKMASDIAKQILA